LYVITKTLTLTRPASAPLPVALTSAEGVMTR
jgi:hypothetical protein